MVAHVFPKTQILPLPLLKIVMNQVKIGLLKTTIVNFDTPLSKIIAGSMMGF